MSSAYTTLGKKKKNFDVSSEKGSAPIASFAPIAVDEHAREVFARIWMSSLFLWKLSF
jgi:hypothetical protein